MDWKWFGWGVFLLTLSFSLFRTMGRQAKDNAPGAFAAIMCVTGTVVVLQQIIYAVGHQLVNWFIGTMRSTYTPFILSMLLFLILGAWLTRPRR